MSLKHMRGNVEDGAMEMGDDDFQWAFELEDDEASREAGAGARKKAAEHAAERSGFQRFIDRVFDRRTDERAWRRGAQGEEEVARRLAGLPGDQWTVLHDLPLGTRGANLDHLVIGPGGVFALNTKHLTGRVWVASHVFMHNGHKTAYLLRVRYEADATSQRLGAAVSTEVSVSPVIVLMGQIDLTIKESPADVAIVTRRRIRRWLERHPPVADPEWVGSVSRAARLPSTWRDQDGAVHADHPRSAHPEAVTVSRWRRYGKDRLYVNGPGRTSVGYVDLQSGEVHVESEADRGVVEDAAARYLRS